LKLAAADKRREALEAQLKDADAEMAACVQWRLAVSCCDSMILAGDVVFAGGDGRVIGADAATGKPRWSAAVNGRAKGLAVANGRLFVSTDTGAIYCFAPGAAKKPAVVAEAVTPSPYPKDRLAATCASAAEEIVRESRVTRGFCLVLGCETGQLALELARRTQLQILGVEANPQKAAAARKALDAAGVYGARVTVDTVGPERLPYASYFANLIVSESALIGRMPSWSAREMFRVLKPVGGVCMIGQPGDAGGVAVLQPAALARWFQASDVTGAQIGPASAPWAKLTRGALPGAGQWTHEYANAANTACCDDRFV
jgi:SAM-dependent methyltransferase